MPPDDLVEFCAAQHGRVLGTLRLLVRDDAVAEDLCQETFFRVCREWGQVRGHASPGAWAHRVAVNLAMSSFRRQRSERRANARVAGRTPVAISAEGLEPDERAAVFDALGVLDDRHRAVVVLRYFAELSVSEVAEVLSMPVGTVKTCTRRALAEMRAAGLIEEVQIDD